MIKIAPVTLELNGVRLEPMTRAHAVNLAAAAADGALWNLRVTFAPRPDEAAAYVNQALEMQEAGTRLPFIVRELSGGKVIGTTSYLDIAPEVDRVEIGSTWYAQSWQRTHVNTSCKLMLLRHAFETLGCKLVAFRTDNFNFASQRAIERLGARHDGVIRRDRLRRDGTVRDTVIYSIAAGDWPEIEAHLRYKLAQRAPRDGVRRVD